MDWELVFVCVHMGGVRTRVLMDGGGGQRSTSGFALPTLINLAFSFFRQSFTGPRHFLIMSGWLAGESQECDGLCLPALSCLCTWVLGIEFKHPCLPGNPCTTWAIPNLHPASGLEITICIRFTLRVFAYMYVCAPTNVVWCQRVLEVGVLDSLKLQLQTVVSARNCTWVLCSKLPRTGNFTNFTVCKTGNTGLVIRSHMRL